jgi:GntR family transcriptional repressor for pyruvate dehydrogenase complex
LISVVATRSQSGNGADRLGWIRPLAEGRSFANVIEQFREAIDGGELIAGDKLPAEPDLATMFGISRSVVREALKVLELSGYLEVRRGYGGGTFVCAARPDEFAEVAPAAMPTLTLTFEQLVQVRLAIEPHAARLAANDGPNRPEGRSAGVSADGAGDETRPARVLAANVDFHVDIARIADNPMFVSVVESLRPALYWAMRHAVEDPSWRREAAARHEGIAEAIAAGDADLAAQLMEEDLLAEAERSDFTPMPHSG